ncbi:carboxypeptidase regulatory-like domain-containing protein, partial [bacterium]
MTRPSPVLMTSLALTWLLVSLPAVQAQPGAPTMAKFENDVLVIRGVAKTQSGQPLANATLFLFDLPDAQFGLKLGDRNKVTTDAEGNFAWTVPTDLRRDVEAYTRPEDEVPKCFALPLEPGTAAVPTKSFSHEGPDWRRRVLEDLALRCQTKWLTRDKNRLLSVVAPDRGRAEIKLRDPAGQPLANKAVLIEVLGLNSDYAGATVFQGKTDLSGRLVWQGYSGSRQLSIKVPGVGFGTSGHFELLPDRLVSVSMPALAPFSQVSGTVDTGLLKPGSVVHAADYSGREKWYNPSAVVDAQGHFSLEGLVPGERRLVLEGGTVSGSVTVNLAPGEKKNGVVFAAAPPRAVAPRELAEILKAVRQPTSVRVRGRVTNAQGAGVGGIEVFAVCTFNGGIRSSQEILNTTTDPNGNYVIENLHRGGVSLVAFQPTGPVALGMASPALGQFTDDFAEDLRGDLVLPAAHNSLKIKVLREGRPVPGATVRLTPQSGTGLYPFNIFGSSPEPAEARFRNMLTPIQKTDEQGEAVFDDLTPGRWDILASTVDANYLDDLARGGWIPDEPPTASNIASTVDVQSGQSSAFSLNIFPATGDVAFQVEAPDGTALNSNQVLFEYGPAVAQPNISPTLTTRVQLSPSGLGNYRVGKPGLWRIGARFGDTPGDKYVEP